MTGVDGVRRWRVLSTAIAVLAALLVWTQPAPAAEAAEPADPLRITLSNIAPSSIPRSGPIVMAGQVHNTSDESWSTVRVYPVFSEQPMTTAEEVAEAAASDPLTTASGTRLTDEGQFAEIDRLDPGESAAFRIRIPRRQLPISGTPGVYWVGAQALGTSEQGRDLLADGRIRSFLPLVPRRSSARLALVAPMRQYVERDVDTRVVKPAKAAELFGPDGRLGRLLGTLADEPAITWLLDPSLLDVAADLGDNNPPLSLGPDEPAPSEKPSASTGSTDSQGSPAPTLNEDARRDVTDWLSTLTGVLTRAGETGLLTLPYADADAFGLLRHRPELLMRAHELSASRLTARGLDATPAVATPNGRIDTALLARAEDGVATLGSAPTRTSTPGITISGRRVVLTQASAADGGPDPRQPQVAFQMRQRILAEAALQAISGDTDPLVVKLPDDWDPGARWAQSAFTRGLQPEWLDLVPLPASSASEGAAEELAEGLPYRRSDRRAEIDPRLITQGERLMRTSSVLSHLLDTENNVAVRLRAMAFRGTSYAARKDQPSAASLVSTMVDKVKGLTDQVSVVGTQFVTLSGGSGTITVSVNNGLSQPVVVGLDVRARNQGTLEFEETEPVTLQPQQRTTVRLQVSTSRLGVNEVTISPTTDNGRIVGTPLEVTVRSSEVGRWFWSVMIGAGCVLVVMIAKRIRDRIRTRRWRPVEE